MSSAGAIEAGRAYVLIQTRDGLSPGFSAIRNRLQNFAREIDRVGQSIARVAAVSTSAFAGIVAGLVLPVKLASSVETLRAEFETLTGSVKVASNTIEDLKKFATVTPFSTEGLASATRLLLNFGIPAKQAVEDIRRLGEISGGSQDKLNLLSLAFAQVAAKGRLMGQEALQLTEQGFNPLQEISRMTGQSMLELSDKMSKGAISFDQVRAAVINATSVGGRFNGMLDRMSKTVSGQWASLKEELADVARSIGEKLLPIVRDWLAYARDVIKRVGDWSRDNKILAGGIAALATGVGVFTVAVTGVTLALYGMSTAVLVISGGMGVVAKLFGSTGKEMNRTARATKAAATSVTASVVAMSSTSDPLLMTTKKLVNDLSFAFRRVGTVAKASMTAVQGSVDAATKSVTVQIAEMIAAVQGLNVALGSLPGASLPDTDGDEKRKKKKTEVGGMRGRAGFLAAAAAGAGAEKALADNMARTASTVQVANRELAAGLAGRAALIELSTTAITRSTQVAGLQGRAAMVGAVTESSGLFARMLSTLSGGLRVIGGLLTGTTAAVAALAVAGTAAFAGMLQYIGYLAPLMNRVKAAVVNIANTVSLAFGGIGAAISKGDWAKAFEIAWLGIKVSALKGIEALMGQSGNLLQQFGNFVIDFAQGLVDATVDIFWGLLDAINRTFWAAVQGVASFQQLITDVRSVFSDAVAGDGSVLRAYTSQAEKDLLKAIDSVTDKTKAAVDSSKKPERAERKLTEQERFAANVGRGVDQRAASLPDATIDDANAAAEERLKTLREEIAELQIGAAAYEQNKLAIEGVTLANRKSIAALEAQKVAVEATNSAKDKIKTLQDEIAGIKFGSENVERYRLAQEGADKVLLSRLASLQAEKTALETLGGLRDQINESILGADAANQLKLAQQGLTKQQLASVSAMSELARRFSDARALADELKDRYLTPLQSFEQTAAKIRDAQLAGMINQEVAARAYSDAMLEMQAKTDELNAKVNEGPKFTSTFEERRDLFKGVEDQARQARAMAEGQRQAALNARDAAKLALGNKDSKLSPAEQLQLALMREQNEVLLRMDKSLAQPKIVVGIP